MALNVIDIASYQSGLDLNVINYDGVVVKATQGTTYVNPFCDVQYQTAKAAGKKLAVYHYADGGDAVAEADFFVDTCAGYIREAIFVLDWEGSGVEFTAWALQFLQHVESRIGYKPAIYMSEWVENQYDWSAVVANDNGLWAAKYSDYEIDNAYDMSNAGREPNVTHWPFYFMWQWTSKGRLSGYAGDLDCDIFYGDGASWDAYAGVQAPIPVPVTTTTTSAAVDIPVVVVTTTLPAVTFTTTEVTTDPVVLPPVKPSFNLGQYRKFIVALIGAAVTVAVTMLGVDNATLNSIIAVLAALGVYSVANEPTK